MWPCPLQRYSQRRSYTSCLPSLSNHPKWVLKERYKMSFLKCSEQITETLCVPDQVPRTNFHSSPSAFLLAPPFPPSPILPHPLLCYFHLYMFAIIRFFCVFNTCIQWDSEEKQLYLQSRRFQNRNLSLLLCLTPG